MGRKGSKLQRLSLFRQTTFEATIKTARLTIRDRLASLTGWTVTNLGMSRAMPDEGFSIVSAPLDQVTHFILGMGSMLNDMIHFFTG
jgi:hypothetical protein